MLLTPKAHVPHSLLLYYMIIIYCIYSFYICILYYFSFLFNNKIEVLYEHGFFKLFNW